MASTDTYKVLSRAKSEGDIKDGDRVSLVTGLGIIKGYIKFEPDGDWNILTDGNEPIFFSTRYANSVFFYLVGKIITYQLDKSSKIDW